MARRKVQSEAFRYADEMFAASHKIDATYLMQRLSIGGAPPRGRYVATAGFTALVLCAEEYQPRSSYFPGLAHLLHCPLDDAKPTEREVERAMETAMYVAELYQAGEDILVTCIAGRNRSGLVCALSMQLITDMPMGDIVEYIQAARVDSMGGAALQNPHFLNLLASLDAGCGCSASSSRR